MSTVERVERAVAMEATGFTGSPRRGLIATTPARKRYTVASPEGLVP